MADPVNVLITGANRGIGLELARCHLNRGDNVIGAVRRPEAASALTHAGEAGTGRLQILPLELADDASIASFAAAVRTAVDHLDLLYNNAGVLSDQEALGNLKGDALAHMFRINATGPVLLIQALRPLLRTGEPGARVVNVSSGYGSISRNDGSFLYGYAASKAALNMFTRSAAHTLRDDGIVVVAVGPGWVRTDMGGPDATMSVEESVTGIVSVVDRLTAADSGTFVRWDGRRKPW